MEFLRRHGKSITGSVLNCGSNNDLFFYWRFFPNCSRYRLLDLEIPKEWPAKPRGQPWQRSQHLIIADVQDMPKIPSDSEDCIIAYWFLYFLPNIGKALAEFRRILRPNGILLASFIGDDLKFNPNVLRRWTHIEVFKVLEPFFEVEEVELYCEARDELTEGRFTVGTAAIGWSGLKWTFVCARAGHSGV